MKIERHEIAIIVLALLVMLGIYDTTKPREPKVIESTWRSLGIKEEKISCKIPGYCMDAFNPDCGGTQMARVDWYETKQVYDNKAFKFIYDSHIVERLTQCAIYGKKNNFGK